MRVTATASRRHFGRRCRHLQSIPTALYTRIPPWTTSIGLVLWVRVGGVGSAARVTVHDRCLLPAQKSSFGRSEATGTSGVPELCFYISVITCWHAYGLFQSVQRFVSEPMFR